MGLSVHVELSTKVGKKECWPGGVYGQLMNKLIASHLRLSKVSAIDRCPLWQVLL